MIRKNLSRAAHFALTLGLAASGCGKSGVEAEISSFKDQGHATSAFTDIDNAGFGAKKCQTGTVDELPVLLCQYENGDAAALGHPAAEAWGGATGTVVVLHRGGLLFAVADRTNADQNGQKISALAKVFRRVKGR